MVCQCHTLPAAFMYPIQNYLKPQPDYMIKIKRNQVSFRHTWGGDGIFFILGGGVNFSGEIFGYYCIFITKYFQKTSEGVVYPGVSTFKKRGRPSKEGVSPCPGMLLENQYCAHLVR